VSVRPVGSDSAVPAVPHGCLGGVSGFASCASSRLSLVFRRLFSIFPRREFGPAGSELEPRRSAGPAGGSGAADRGRECLAARSGQVGRCRREGPAGGPALSAPARPQCPRAPRCAEPARRAPAVPARGRAPCRCRPGTQRR
jgi:hypothetical protein